MSQPGNPKFSAYKKLLASFSEAGYVAIVINAGEDRAQQRFVVDQLLARQVDALILYDYETMYLGFPIWGETARLRKALVMQAGQERQTALRVMRWLG